MKLYLHALYVLVDAAFAEFVQTATSWLWFEVDSRANLAQQWVILDDLEETSTDVLLPFICGQKARLQILGDDAHSCDCKQDGKYYMNLWWTGVSPFGVLLLTRDLLFENLSSI